MLIEVVHAGALAVAFVSSFGNLYRAGEGTRKSPPETFPGPVNPPPPPGNRPGLELGQVPGGKSSGAYRTSDQSRKMKFPFNTKAQCSFSTRNFEKKLKNDNFAQSAKFFGKIRSLRAILKYFLLRWIFLLSGKFLQNLAKKVETFF